MLQATLGPEIWGPMRKTQLTGWGKGHRQRTVTKGPMPSLSLKNLTPSPWNTFFPQSPLLHSLDAKCSLSQTTVLCFHLDSSNKITSTDTAVTIWNMFFTYELSPQNNPMIKALVIPI